MSNKRRRKKKQRFGVYIFAAILIIVVITLMPSSVSNRRSMELTELNATPSPTPEPTPTPTPSPTPTPLPTYTPQPTISPTPEPTPVLKYAGTTIKGISILQKSALEKDNRIYNIMSIIPDDGLPIPRLYQFNYKTPICYYYGGRKTVSSSGCGPTCISMIVAWIKGNYDQTPYTQMYTAASVGDYFGAGLTVDAVEHMLKLNDIDCHQEEVDQENILRALHAGSPCIMRMGPGTFTRAGHYILLRGFDANGKILVNDPNSEVHSYTSYDISLIVRQAKKPTFVVVEPLNKQNGVSMDEVEMNIIITTQPPLSGVSIGFCTLLDDTDLMLSAGFSSKKYVRLERGSVLEIVEKTAVSGDDKLWYGVAYNGSEYFLRSNSVAAEWYEQSPDSTPEPDATDNPDPETAA